MVHRDPDDHGCGDRLHARVFPQGQSGGTGFMHESFHKDNPEKFTRAWFAWQNTLFGELILELIDEGRLDLLNSIDIK